MEGEQGSHSKKPQDDLGSLTNRQYLDVTVVPILVQAMAHLAKERPPEPISALAAYLMQHKTLYEGGPQSLRSSAEENELD